MELENEAIEKNTTEDLEQNQIPVQRQDFKISMPDGREVEASTLSDENYKLAATLQYLQKQVQELGKHVTEFELKKDHFDLKIKQFEDLLPPNGKQQTDSISLLEAHERECAIRFQFIEDRLDEGSAKFKRLEGIMWGMYPFIITCLVVSKYL